MAYSTSIPPRRVSGGIGNCPGVWHYSSADAKATVNGAGYITNGVALGMKLGDVVHIFDTNLLLYAASAVKVVNAASVDLVAVA